MTKNNDFSEVFDQLRSILSKHEKKLSVVTDSDKSYYLNTQLLMKNKKPMFFGSVAVKKNYVAYHLMPVYVNPDLLNEITPELKKCQQGKSCFNFKVVDKKLFKEIEKLTKAGLAEYKQQGYLK